MSSLQGANAQGATRMFLYVIWSQNVPPLRWLAVQQQTQGQQRQMQGVL